MEANNHALQVTPHACQGGQNHYYPSCDRGGCAQNTHRLDPKAYGPGDDFTINKNNPFQLSISFKESGGALTSIATVLSQGSKSFTIHHNDQNCGGGKLQNMGQALENGMVVVVSYVVSLCLFVVDVTQSPHLRVL